MTVSDRSVEDHSRPRPQQKMLLHPHPHLCLLFVCAHSLFILPSETGSTDKGVEIVELGDEVVEPFVF